MERDTAPNGRRRHRRGLSARGRRAGLGGWSRRVLLLLVLVCATGAFAQEDSGGAGQIVNGLVESLEPTTGALLLGTDPDSAFPICTGTLIGCETFLTAAHCVCSTNGGVCNGLGAPDPGDFSVFLQHAGLFGVARIDVPTDFDFPVADVALLKLASPVSGIAPIPINTVRTPPWGTPGTIVGFGTSAGGASDGGIKRAGEVVTARCAAPTSGTTSVCWDFLRPIGDAGEDSNTCFGDSGGPLFVDLGGGPVVAGVTSGGTNGTCFPPDNSYDANVFHYSGWIAAQAGEDLNNTSCGQLFSVGDPQVVVHGFSGSLSASTPQASHSFLVPSGTEELRVTFNGTDDGFSDFDLYVKSGDPPTASNFDCARSGPGQIGACLFSAPAWGPWYLLLDRFQGSGVYQLTATSFRSTCSDPANAGQPCDDSNPCTLGDFCQGGECTGTIAPDDAPCEDGSLCTRGDACQAGVCVSGASPVTGCRRPIGSNASRFVLVDKSPDRRDRLLWKWGRGEETSAADLGDPMASTDYALCVYDEVMGIPELRSETVIPAGEHWSALSDGYKYVDRNRLNGGVNKVLLNQGTDGRARIVLRAMGRRLDTPVLPLRQQSRVVVQLLNGDTCFEAEYSSSLLNESQRFRALSD